MSFCCGASMIGTKGTLKHLRTQIHNVPLLLCPVCHRVEVHHLIESEYEILLEYAQGDGASEVDFQEYVETKEPGRIFENCVNHESEDPLEMVKNQIDMALDLFIVAKQLQDEEWQDQLRQRLEALSRRRNKLRQKKTAGGYRS